MVLNEGVEKQIHSYSDGKRKKHDVYSAKGSVAAVIKITNARILS